MKDDLSFPSLETLEFYHMKNLKGWWRQEIPEEMQRRPCLAKVSRVIIHGCKELMGRMPLFEGVEFLKLKEVDVKLVAGLLPSVNLSCSPHSSFIAPCGIIDSANNKLKELELWCIEGLICLPEEWIRHLAALQRLDIRGWGAQRVSRRGLSHLTALKELVLESDNCEIGDKEEDGDEKKDVDVGMPWKALRGLETLRLSAKMHDLVHDVAIDVSKTDAILFDKDSINKRKMDSLRHISIDSEVVGSVDYCNLVSEPNTVRTLLCQPTWETNFQISQGSLDMLVKSFRLLRTLSLPDQGIINVSSSIGELIHLRYLDLSNNKNLKHLPKSICRLHNLMTLELRNCGCLEKLPPKIEKLVSLRQLCIEGCEKLDCLPPGLKALTSLVNLDRLIVHCQSGGLGYLEGLDNLCGVLRIELPEEGWSCAVEDAKISNMSKKHKLSRMVIEWKGKGSYTGQEMGKDEATKVVEVLEPHHTLEYLEINNYGGEKLPSWFCMLKNVKEIILNGCEHVEYIEDVMKDGLSFPSLETLEFCFMKNLRGWWRQEIPEEMQRRPCLTKVSRVTIESCRELVGRMPLFEGVEFLKLVAVDVKLVAKLLLSVNSSCSPHSSFIAPCGIINSANNKLKELELWCFEGLICLPEEWIRHLAALQRLEIHGRGVKRVSRRGLSHLTALKELVLHSDDCEIGDEEEDGDEKKDVDVGMPWKALCGLKTLTLPVVDRHLHEGLAYLSCLKSLEIKKWKGVQLGDGETLGVQLPSKDLQNLVTLKLGFEEEGRCICHLPKVGIQHLHSLQYLRITGCKELYLCWNLLKLEELSLDRVGRVIDVEDDWVGDQPTQLRSLEVKHCKDKEWAHDIPWKSISSSLKRLILDNIGEREDLPDGIQHLTFLQDLYIWECEKLKSVPTWLPHLTSLQTLSITGCSAEIKRRCERERGEDWPLIRHIPYIFVHARVVAEEEKEEARKIGWCGLTR